MIDSLRKRRTILEEGSDVSLEIGPEGFDPNVKKICLTSGFKTKGREYF